QSGGWPIAPLSSCRREMCDLPPLLESLAHDVPVALGRQTMSPRTEVVAHRAECLQESLRLLRRLEPLHCPLAFADRPMRIPGSIVQSFVPTVVSVWHDPLDSRHV